MNRFKNILVSVDTRSTEHPALDWAMTIAEKNSAKLTVVEVLPKFSWIQRHVLGNSEELHNRMVDDSKSKLDALLKTALDRGIEAKSVTLTGNTSEEITDEVVRSEHDLVVRLAKGENSRSNKPFGATGMRLLRTCGCAVLLVQRDKPANFDCIMAAIDPASDDPLVRRMNTNIVKLAISASELGSGELHIVHAWQLFGSTNIKSRVDQDEFEKIEKKAQNAIAATLDDFLQPFELTHDSPQVHLVREESRPSTAIINLADQYKAPLIVMGTVARSGLRGVLMGNTAEQVLEQVTCSVLVIKPDSYASPN